ncbi:MAG: beta-ketoacyl synthase N-terminal-like domain-containing protein [Phycisphaerae bacterium]
MVLREACVVKSPVVIAGCSVLTPLDVDGRSTWEAVCAGERVGQRVAVAEDLLRGELELDRSIRLALGAVERLGVDVRKVELFCGTSKGPVGTYLAAMERMSRGEQMTEMQARHVALGVGAMGAFLREHLGICGPVHTSVAACSSGMHAFHRAEQAIERGECARALVVAADASLHPLFEGSFARLGVLAKGDERGVRRCEPFGENGEGFFLVEAGAAVLLENQESRSKNQEGVLVEGTWIGGDSTGLIAIDEGTRTLRAGLRRFAGSGLAFVHAHATGTGHDKYEMGAIRSVFPEVPVFSHKKWLGHSLGAAGLVSVVLSAMSHARGRTPSGERVAAGARSVTIAQGFGGHIGVIGLRG